MPLRSVHTKKARAVWDRHFSERLGYYGIKSQPKVLIITAKKTFLKAWFRTDSPHRHISYKSNEMGRKVEIEGSRHRRRMFEYATRTGGVSVKHGTEGELSPGYTKRLEGLYERELSDSFDERESMGSMIKMRLAEDDRHPVYISKDVINSKKDLDYNVIAEGSHVIYGHVKNRIFERLGRRYEDELGSNPLREHSLSEAFDGVERHLALPTHRVNLLDDLSIMARAYSDPLIKERAIKQHPESEIHINGFALSHLIIKTFKEEADIKKAASIILAGHFRTFQEAYSYFRDVGHELHSDDNHARKKARATFEERARRCNQILRSI